MTNDRIEINFDGEDDPGPPPVPTPPNNRLIVTNDDLTRVPDPPANYGRFAPMYTQPYAQKPKSKAAMSTVTQGLVAGLVGGFLAWALTEPFESGYGMSHEFFLSLIHCGIFFGVIGGLIGACLSAADGVVSGVYEKAMRAGLVGLGIGAGGGFVGGILGQGIYAVLGGSSGGAAILARAFGWAAAGSFLGLGQGFGRGSQKRAVNGLIGGAIGGVLAGLLFDPICMLVQTDILSRFIGIILLGGASGAAIGMVEEMRKEAWLSIVRGPLAGKQFILFDAVTRIGSSPKCEITLVKDSGVASEHALIEMGGGGCTLLVRDVHSETLLDGRPVVRERLRSGGVITIGSTQILFEERPPKFGPRL